MKLAAALAVGLIVARPAAAQLPMPPDAMADGAERAHAGNPMFAGMSDAGRAIMRAALRDADPRGARETTAAARDRMLAVLDAERLDTVALKRAMDDEREAANAAKVRHQAALIAGFQQLSAADRHAFVVNARQLRARVEERLATGRRGPGPFGAPPR